MRSWIKVLVALLVISLGLGFGARVYYKKSYEKPRNELVQKIETTRQQIANGKTRIETMKSRADALTPLFTRSFPLSEEDAGLQYEMWLSQMLEFCNVPDALVTKGRRVVARQTALGTQSFRIEANCELVDIVQFLYEFYWTPFLHRVTALDVAPIEGSDRLKVVMTIEGLTILYKRVPNQPYPLQNQLPLDVEPIRQLASGPFAAYEPLGALDAFRAVRTGVDPTSLAILTGLPISTDENGNSAVFTRWNLEDQGKSLTLKIGDQMKIGSFSATILDVEDNLVVLKQNNGRLWAVLLGSRLSEAVAIPENLF